MLGKSLPRERCEKARLKPEPGHVCSGPSDSVLKPSGWSYENMDEGEDVSACPPLSVLCLSYQVLFLIFLFL